MPHKVGVKQLETKTNAIASMQTEPLSTEGFNSTNIPSLNGSLYETVNNPLIQQQRLHQINKSILYTDQHLQQNQASQHTQNMETYGLVRPVVCTIPKPEDKMTPLDNQIAQAVAIKIWDAVVYNKLYYFFTLDVNNTSPFKTPQERLQDVVDKATMHDYQMLMELLKIPNIDQATDLCVLALFDVIVLVDDSSSMKTTGNMNFNGTMERTVDYEADDLNDVSRWDLVSSLVNLMSFVLTLFDDDGISVRFLNKDKRYLPEDVKVDGIKSSDSVKKLFTYVKPAGGTAIGQALTNIYYEFLRDQLKNQTLSKPVLILTFTDGESSDNIITAVKNIRNITRQTKYNSRSVLFSFSQVGRDPASRKMLGILDTDDDTVNKTTGKKCEDGAGDITDCTSAYPDEEKEYNERQKLIPLEERCPYSIGFHNVKTLVGPIIEKYDISDEEKSVQSNLSQFAKCFNPTSWI